MNTITGEPPKILLLLNSRKLFHSSIFGDESKSTGVSEKKMVKYIYIYKGPNSAGADVDHAPLLPTRTVSIEKALRNQSNIPSAGSTLHSEMRTEILAKLVGAVNSPARFGSKGVYIGNCAATLANPESKQ